ncbi:Uncharacterised protein [Mycobacteroides abscessus subsp. abscessus]|nr:Uncharacterised protein [Mycobacteroides abscessus subsp. abscessus]
MSKISDSVEGATVAPAMPSSARHRIRISALGAKAATIETRLNSAAPNSSIRRLPSRSPSVPAVISSPATMNP